jgi:hypothetical protein
VAWEHPRNIPDRPLKVGRKRGRRGGREERGVVLGSRSASGADSGHTSAQGTAAVLKARERGAASGRVVRPLVGDVKAGDLLVVFDGSIGRRRRRTLGPVPQLQVPQDLLNDRTVADQADDGKRSRAAGTNQGRRFVDFLNQPGSGAPAGARELPATVGFVLVHSLHCGCRRRCRSNSKHVPRSGAHWKKPRNT